MNIYKFLQHFFKEEFNLDEIDSIRNKESTLDRYNSCIQDKTKNGYNIEISKDYFVLNKNLSRFGYLTFSLESLGFCFRASFRDHHIRILYHGGYLRLHSNHKDIKKNMNINLEDPDFSFDIFSLSDEDVMKMSLGYPGFIFLPDWFVHQFIR